MFSVCEKCLDEEPGLQQFAVTKGDFSKVCNCSFRSLESIRLLYWFYLKNHGFTRRISFSFKISLQNFRQYVLTRRGLCRVKAGTQF